MTISRPHIIVVGAGIIGSSLAHHLIRAHAQVTLIDRASKPAAGATGKSFGWITAGAAMPEHYHHFRQLAIDDWHRLENELNGQLPVDWPGALIWQKDGSATSRIAGELTNFGHKVKLIDRKEIIGLEPNLKHVPEIAISAENEGAIDPLLTTQILINSAREKGAKVQQGNQVLEIMSNGSRVTGVVTANGPISADLVVLASGVDSAEFCMSLGFALPLETSPAILMKFFIDNRFVNKIISNPLMEIRAASNQILIAAEDYFDSHESNLAAIARQTFENIKASWKGADHIELTNVTVGQRPVPVDGLPVIGYAPGISGLYITAMHTGITLAAIAGRLAAAEILSGRDDALLMPYRPSRFI